VTAPPRYRAYGRKHLDRLPQLQGLSDDQRLALEAVSAVLPFRVNSYVLDELIDWDDIPNDPIYQLTFPQAGMIESSDFTRLVDQVVRKDQEGLERVARSIQHRMNPHPSGQMELNVPTVDGEPLPGAQHKYRETMLFFPSQGQTCHAYCTYCFRWAQFVGVQEFKISNREASTLHRYVEAHQELTDILFTGGDPLVMSTNVLRRYVEPLLSDTVEHVQSIRLGTKALGYWPQRFLTDPDADDLLRLFEEVRASGRQLALMAHFSHPRELETPLVQEAMRRIVNTGAVIRCQAPLIRHVNDDADAWARMWNLQVRLGAVPYYFFVERDTGPKHYFEVPLARALKIFTQAYSRVSGLARTVRGPSMSATPGKVLVDGVTEINGEKVFVLKFIQARETDWVNRVFFAKFDSQAAWLPDLEPACGDAEFFFERPMRLMEAGTWQPEWREDDDAERASA
jgi:KamA family protein